MHTLSVLSIGRATKELANANGKKLTIRVGKSLAEIIDDNGDIIDYGLDSANLSKRLRARATIQDLEELLM